jgi:hypothetical protein
MLFDEEDGYTPEYIYGNYFERLLGKTAASTTATPKQEQEENEDEEEGEEEKIGNLGLRELIDGGDSGAARILHRIISAGSPRLVYTYHFLNSFVCVYHLCLCSFLVLVSSHYRDL